MQMIAISCGLDDEDYCLRRYYVDMVRDMGAYPVILPGGAPPALPPGVDALILSGGGDVAAEFCGLEPAFLRSVDVERDRFELAIVLAAVSAGLPILGICRGMQVLNLALGGSILADIPQGGHEQPYPAAVAYHEVDILQPEWQRLVGERMAVNSFHHQAIDSLAPGFSLVGRAADGVPEAMSDAEGRMIGVQWHPERRYIKNAAERKWLDKWFALSRK